MNSPLFEVIRAIVGSPLGMLFVTASRPLLFKSLLFSLFFTCRFAEFVEGKSHLSDRELLDYETTALMPTDNNLTDDESEDD